MRLESAQPAHPVLHLRDDLGLAVELVDTEVLTELVDDGQERAGLTERDAAALEPRRGLARRREPALELEQEPRLPDARFAGDEHDLPPALPGSSEQLHEGGDLSVSSNEGREAALALDVQPCLAAARPQDLERLDRRVPLHGQLAQIARFEVAGDEPRRRRAGEHAARACVLLQAGGHVGGVTDRRVVHPEIVADLAHDDRSRVETDSHLEAPVETWRQLAAQVTDAALDREGGVSGAPGRVLVRDRRAEQGHDPVAGVLIDRALEPVHLGRDHLEATIDDGVDLFGITALGERAESGQIGEQHRHLPPLALDGGPGLEDLLGEVFGRISGLGASRRRRRA